MRAAPVIAQSSVSSLWLWILILMAVVVAACIPNALLRKQNISIEVLGDLLGGRAQLMLNAFASLAVLLFFGLLTWKFIPYAASVTASQQTTWVLKLPVGPWWWVATGCLAVAVLAQLAVLITDLGYLFGKHDAPAPPLDDTQNEVL